MTLNQNPEEKAIQLQEQEDQEQEQQDQGQEQGDGVHMADHAETIAEDDQPLELVQELEYIKPAAGEKRRKKDEDEDEGSDLALSSVAEARAVLEGYLFTSNEPLSVNRLCKLMNNLNPRTVRGLLLELQMDYDNRAGALQIVEIAGGFQMATRPHLADWMFRMHRHKRRSALSPATLETLAIIAYKQPITKGEIEGIRGVESSGTVRTLQDLNLVEASGRREVVGRPQLFVTTDQFLKAFGLKSLAELPSIAELRQLFANDQKLKAAVAQQADETNGEQVTASPPDLGEPAEKPESNETEESPSNLNDSEAEPEADNPQPSEESAEDAGQ